MSRRTILSMIAFHCLESGTIKNGQIPLDSFESVGIESIESKSCRWLMFCLCAEIER